MTAILDSRIGAAQPIRGSAREGRSLVRRSLGYKYINAFTFVCFLAPPVFGSTVSFVFIGGAIWCLFEILSGRRDFSRDRGMIAITAALYLYCLTNLFSTVWAARTSHDYLALIPLVTFLVFPFSYSIWAISEKATIARMCVLGSMAASYGALAFALVQAHIFYLRAEGGAGNALVFATVTCLAGSVSLAGMFFEDKRLAAPLLGGFFAALLAIIYAEARMVWLAVPVVAASICWIHRHSLARARHLHLILLGCTATFAGTLLSFEIVYRRAASVLFDWRQIEIFGNFDTPLGERAAMWHSGMRDFLQAPVVGHGLASTRQLVEAGLHAIHIDKSFNHFHNGFLTVAVQSGTVGVIFYAAVFLLPLVIAYRTFKRSREKVEVFGATLLVVTVLTYLISGLTNLMTGHDIFDSTLMVFLIVGTYLASGRSLLKEAAPSPTSRTADTPPASS